MIIFLARRRQPVREFDSSWDSILEIAMPEHSPEPWLHSKWDYNDVTVAGPIVDANNMLLVRNGDCGTVENFDRIVACVNVCKGIPTDVLSLATFDRTLEDTVDQHVRAVARKVLEYELYQMKEVLAKLLDEAKDLFFHLDHCKGDCRSTEQLDAGKGGGWSDEIKMASELLKSLD